MTSALFTWSVVPIITEDQRKIRGEVFVNVYSTWMSISLVLIVTCIVLKLGSKRENLTTLAWFVAAQASLIIQILILYILYTLLFGPL
jgi:hypothetical protein